jgi:hypothetical protein
VRSFTAEGAEGFAEYAEKGFIARDAKEGVKGKTVLREHREWVSEFAEKIVLLLQKTGSSGLRCARRRTDKTLEGIHPFKGDPWVAL